MTRAPVSTRAEALLETGLDAHRAEDDPEAAGWYGTDWLLAQARAGQSPFAALVEAWLSTFASEHTVAAYRTDLNAWQLYLSRLSPPVEGLVADGKHGDGFAESLRAGGLDDDTRRRRLAAVSSCYRFAVKRGVRSENPLAHTARPPRSGTVRGPRLNPEQVRALIAAADASSRPYAARDRVILRLMARLDIGVLRVCAMNYGHLQMHPYPLLEVRLSSTRREVVGLPVDVFDAMRAYLPTRVDPIVNAETVQEHTELKAKAPLFYLQSPRLQGQRLSRGARITRDAISTRLRAYAEEIAAAAGIAPELLAVLGPADVAGVLEEPEPDTGADEALQATGAG